MNIFLYLLCISTVFFCTASRADYSLVNTTEGSFTLLDENHQSIVTITTIAFKENWQWMAVTQQSMQPHKKENNTLTKYIYTLDKEKITWNMALEAQKKQLVMEHMVSATETIALTYIALSITPSKQLNDGYIIATNSEGKETQIAIPLNVSNTDNIIKMQFFDENKDMKLTVDFSSGINIHNHSSSRIKLTGDSISPLETSKYTMRFSAPEPILFYQSNQQLSQQHSHKDWFTFSPRKTSSKGEIGMQDWLKKSETNLTIQTDKILENNKPYKAWGTNVNYINVAPDRRDAQKRTDFFAKYGINNVRLHKLTNTDWEGLGSTNKASEYDKAKLKRFDYWLSLLQRTGIRYGFSPIWDLRVFEGDRNALIAYDELVSAKPQKPVTTGLVWFAEDIQQLHIDTLTNLLTHKNTYTQQRYADDPALAYIEIQNEENVFFYSFMSHVKKYPTYHKILAEQFSEWLIGKYQDHRGLVNAWGASAIDTFKNEGGLPNEQLELKNITPVTNPWFHDNQIANSHRAKRLQDTAEFLFFKQQQYYAKAEKAIRNTGYKGMIVSSNWQAGNKGAHFLNLLSDANIGVVDRHNYQGGAKGSPGYTMKSGFEMINSTMLDNPGSGLLSTGMQQVANRPFMFSEWLSVLPSEWAAADTSIIAAYGFGLQGWDMSYHFASDGNEFSKELNPHFSKFNNLTPVGVGLYPVLSRMVLRQDISEAEPIATRRLNKQQAITNDYDFSNTSEQQHDTKSFSGTPHHHALAAGKVLVEFTKENGVSTIDDWKEKYQRKNRDGSTTITSSTKQLSWTFSDKKQQGFVAINSDGTQGIVGFAKNTPYPLKDITIQPQSPYSVILATAKSPTGTLVSDNEVIILAIARAHNTNMNIAGDLLANAGEAPVILEPVKARIQFKRKGVVHVLDHGGIKTGKTYATDNGVFELDTARDKTIYYLVTFD